MTSAPPPAKLDLSRVVAEAFALPWKRRDVFVKALALPALAIVAIQVGWGMAEGRVGTAVGWAAWAGYGILWILYAVACHRLVLLDLGSAEVSMMPGWGRRETVFVAWVLAICVTTYVAAGLAVMTVGTVIANLFSTALFEAVYQQFMLLLATYVFARLALLLPAAAIDARTTFLEAWRQTRGNGWRMVVVVGVLPWTFRYLANFVEGDDPGMAKGVIMTALATILLAVEISALSLSYRQLAAEKA
ncbi:MAG: hypothetical protein H7Y14_01985 [Burkholderiales bacterium]|nr:hypothetical protein [Burkholderiales bacterium]